MLAAGSRFQCTDASAMAGPLFNPGASPLDIIYAV